MRTPTTHIGKWIGLREVILLAGLLVGTFFVYLALVIAPPAAASTEEVAASHLGNPSSSNYYVVASSDLSTYAFGQTFTSAKDGQVSGAEVLAWVPPTTPPTTATVEIREISIPNDRPWVAKIGDTPIAKASNVTFGQAPGALTRVSFDSTGSLVAGQKYALLIYMTSANSQLTLATPQDDTWATGWVGITYQDPVLGTALLNLYGSGRNADIIFAVYVTPSQQYDFSGFFAPVDNPGPGPDYVYNTVKAGSAIPVKFNLAGDQGLEIFAAGYPVSQQIPKVAGVDTDAIEQTVSAGQSGLSYDQLTGQYTYVWKTEKSWAKSDRELILKLADGTEHTALFRFTK